MIAAYVASCNVEGSNRGLENLAEVVAVLQAVRGVVWRGSASDFSGHQIQVRIPPSGNVQDTLGEIAALPGVRQVSVTGLHEVD